MTASSLSVRLAFVFSVSVTASSFSPPPQFDLKATVPDLLALLGSKQQATTVNHRVADDLKSCFKFLVPFAPAVLRVSGFESRRALRGVSKSQREKEDELVWWPPEPVMELARLAVDSRGDPAAIHRALDPKMLTVPDVEGCVEDHCELTRTPYGRLFINTDLNSYLEFLFKLIVIRGPSIGLNVTLSRYDFFHGHMFLATGSGRLGILFHAKEYPQYDKELFPYNMGYCQKGSNLAYDDSMNLRNILWLAPLPSDTYKSWLAPGVLVVLDSRPGGIIYTDIIPDYVRIARTIYEDDFGEVTLDVNYLNVGGPDAKYRIFLC
ncbi:unnamed protein product [Rhodiola kirilowii]